MIELNDVAFGDIWLCSGQSNMEFQLQSVFDAENEINNIIETTPEMRLFHVKHKTSPEPIEDLEDADIQYNWGKAGDGGPNLRYYVNKSSMVIIFIDPFEEVNFNFKYICFVCSYTEPLLQFVPCLEIINNKN